MGIINICNTPQNLMTEERNIKINRAVLIQLYLITLGLLALSFLRPLLFILLPLFVLGFIFLFKVRYSKNIIFVGASVFIITILSSLYVDEFNFSNNVLSFYFIFPILLIFFSRIKIPDKICGSLFEFFIKVLTIILIVNNCIGFIQFILTPMSDDAFMGFYGKQGLGLHTLSLMNFMICVYYFFLYKYYKKKLNFGLFIFFLSSAFLCFYGLGLIVFVMSVFVYKFSFRAFFKSFFILIAIISFLGGTLYIFRNKTFNYNYENIKKVELLFNDQTDPKFADQIPRKLILYKNYIHVYSKDIGLFLLGSGPGTFNSRTSFLLNGDYSKSGFFESVFGVSSPEYASKYVYPLWESKMISQELYKKGIYNDGTRNEPFSSIIAILAEYGFFITVLLFILIFDKFKILIHKMNSNYLSFNNVAKLNIYRDYIKFVSIFIFLNLFTDNFFEYPEIIFVYLIIFKLIEIAVINLIDHNSSASSLAIDGD